MSGNRAGYKMNTSMTSEKRRLLKHNAAISTPAYNLKYAKYIFIALAICFIGTVVLISRLDIANVIRNSLGVVTIAGCSSLFGGISIFCINRNSASIIPLVLSFSAAILIHLAAMTLIPGSKEEFEHGIHDHDDVMAHLYASISVICGILMTMFIEHSINKYAHSQSFDDDNENANQMVSYSKQTKMKNQIAETQNFHRLSNFVVIVLIFNNVAEGIATFVQLYEDFDDAALIAFALCLRVIPTGVCIAILTFVGCGSKVLSFLLCFMGAIGYCLGGLIGWAMIENAEESVMDILIATQFGIIAGVALYVAFVQLVPNAIAYANEKKTKVAVYWSYIALFVGLFVMELANIVLIAVGFDEGHHHGHHH